MIAEKDHWLFNASYHFGIITIPPNKYFALVHDRKLAGLEYVFGLNFFP